MENGIQNLKTYHLMLGAGFFFLGLLMIFILSGLLRFLGVIIIFGTLAYFASILFRYQNKSDDRFKSHTREEILRHQHKR